MSQSQGLRQVGFFDCAGGGQVTFEARDLASERFEDNEKDAAQRDGGRQDVDRANPLAEEPGGHHADDQWLEGADDGGVHDAGELHRGEEQGDVDRQ